MLWCSVVLLALFASAQGRAVNISNTWVLPEEGFPVFYRYFRDRISWYEADAVCQFHHANLVTVDTTAQYDAVRAYLKELDISSAVWVGLIRSNPDGDFTWTDYRGLSGDGYWSSAPDTRAAPLCAAADPAADYRWEARACGGPTVASFICELPVPQWALGNEGCMVRALPALTILYLPESAAVQLTADCGLAGVKRVQCTGNVKREDLLKDLSCSDEEEVSTLVSVASSSSTGPLTSDSVITDQDTTTEITTEDSGTTEHEDDINQSSTILPSSSTHNIILVTDYKVPTKPINTNKFNRISNTLDKNIDMVLSHNNNLQSNYIPKIANKDNYLSNEQLEKIEDEIHMKHKMLHEEIARIGNLENIFTQPTDHFVPPLVMAKAKISDDMTVLSLQEKHAQQMAEQHMSKYNTEYHQNYHVDESSILKSTTEVPKAVTIDKILFMQTIKSKDNIRKDKIKTSMPKKYNEKVYDPKSKPHKPLELKATLLEKVTESPLTSTETATKHVETTSLPLVGRLDDDEDSSLDLTVLLKDEPEVHEEKTFYNYSGDVSRLEVVQNGSLNNDTEIKLYDLEATEETKQVKMSHFEQKLKNITLNHEVVKITVITDGHTTDDPKVFEVTTKMPIVYATTMKDHLPVITKNPIDDINFTNSGNIMTTTQYFNETGPVVNVSTDGSNFKNTTDEAVVEQSTTTNLPTTTTKLPTTITTEIPVVTTTLKPRVEDITFKNINVEENVSKETATSTSSYTHDDDVDHFNTEINNSSDTLDDFNSPLLSGANEPIRRPNRSRRPQPPPNRNKFNPFRILG